MGPRAQARVGPRFSDLGFRRDSRIDVPEEDKKHGRRDSSSNLRLARDMKSEIDRANAIRGSNAGRPPRHFQSTFQTRRQVQFAGTVNVEVATAGTCARARGARDSNFCSAEKRNCRRCTSARARARKRLNATNYYKSTGVSRRDNRGTGGGGGRRGTDARRERFFPSLKRERLDLPAIPPESRFLRSLKRKFIRSDIPRGGFPRMEWITKSKRN